MFVISRRLEPNAKNIEAKMEEQKSFENCFVVFVMVAMWNYFENELKKHAFISFYFFSFFMVDITIEFTGI